MAVRSTKKWTKRALCSLLGLSTLWLGGFLWFVADLPVADDGGPAQGIVVLTGGADRMMVGMDLLQQGRGERLLISGVNENVSDDHLQRVLGFPDGPIGSAQPNLFDCCVDTGRDALDTAGNAQELSDWARAHSFTNILVVTAAYHMPRALTEIRRSAPTLTLMAHPVFPDNVKTARWWAHGGTARVLATEYNKYLFSLLRLRFFSGAGDQA